MPTASRPVSRLAKALTVVLVAGALAVGCGGGDTSSSSPTASENDAAPTNDAARSDSRDASATVLGYRMTAEPGTVLEVEMVAVAQGIEQPPTSQTVTIRDEPWQMLFTVFVDSAELTVEITEGAAATIEAIRGRAVDPEDPFAGIEVTETLDTVEVTAGTPATVAVG